MLRAACIIALGVLLSAPLSQAAVVSTFDTGADGWNSKTLSNGLGDPPPVIATTSAVYNPTGGNPGGWISISDPSSQWDFFNAPAAYLGNKLSYYGGTLSFDLKTTSNDGIDYPAVVLVGNILGTPRALYYSTSPPATTFTSYSVGLNPTGWRLGDYVGGSAPTISQFQSVLSSLSALYIDGDWRTAFETAGLDNVRMVEASHEVPEPSTMLLLSLGGLTLTVLSRRRHQGN